MWERGFLVWGIVFVRCVKKGFVLFVCFRVDVLGFSWVLGVRCARAYEVIRFKKVLGMLVFEKLGSSGFWRVKFVFYGLGGSLWAFGVCNFVVFFSIEYIYVFF